MRPNASLWRMAKNSAIEGVFAINKPIGLSSAQVIRDCQAHFNPSTIFAPLVSREVSIRLHESPNERRRRTHAKRDARVKMGHGGTLDPLATGVLILGIGSGTKFLQSFLECTKTYETVVLFGASTDTYDRVGRILTKRPYDEITKEAVEEALGGFRGKFQQTPPLYSALKMEGKPLYEYAREGKPIPREIASREVNVTELELVEWYEPGSHNHRWPAEEAESFERNFAEQVWRNQKQQANSKKLTAEEKKEEQKAIDEHESFKKEFEERQDELVFDQPNKRHRHIKQEPLMSGALGQLPQSPSQKGANLVPSPPAANTPPPWTDKGPPAAKIRMTVTSGFYVRSFCHDLGVKIGSAAMMAELCRTRQGDFSLGSVNCIEYDELAKGEKVWSQKIQDALAHWNATAPISPPQPRQDRLDRQQNHVRKEKRKAREEEASPEGLELKRRRNSSSAEVEIPVMEQTEEPEAQLEEAKEEPEPQKADMVAKNGDSMDTEEEWNGIID